MTTVSVAGLLVLFAVVVAVGLAALSFCGWAGNALLGRHRPRSASPSVAEFPSEVMTSPAGRHVPVVMFLVVLLIPGLVLLRYVRSASHTDDVRIGLVDRDRITPQDINSFPQPSWSWLSARDARRAVVPVVNVDNLPRHDAGPVGQSEPLFGIPVEEAVPATVEEAAAREQIARLTADAGRLLSRQLSRHHGESGRLRQVWLLIPLTVPGTPVPAATQSLRAAEELQSLSASLMTALGEKKTAAAASQVPTSEPAATALPAERTEALAEGQTPPAWFGKPDGGRKIVTTSFAPSGESQVDELEAAVSRALVAHLQEQMAGNSMLIPNWNRLLQLRLSPKALQKCLVDTWDRIEVITTRDGPRQMQQTVALIEFPEAVDNAAVARIHAAVQHQRLEVIALVLGGVWLSVLSLGLFVRFARHGQNLKKLLAAVAVAAVSAPLLLSACGLLVAATRGQVLSFPWRHSAETAIVDVSDAQLVSRP